MKRYFLAILLLTATVSLCAQQWTKERVKAELQKKDFLSTPELASTLQRVFDHQEELGGVRLVGMKTSEKVVEDYMKNVYFDYLADIFLPKNEQGEKRTDQEMQEFFDKHLQEQGRLDALVSLTIRNFADWAVEKYGVRYPKCNLTDEKAAANIKKVPNGIYYKTKNKSTGKDSFDEGIDRYYEIICNGKAYRLTMENVDYETGNFKYRISPSDFRVLECDGKSFQTVWINDNPQQFYFPYDTEVIDLFEPVNSEFAQAFYGMLGNMDSGKKKSVNRFIGAWKCVKGYKNETYKVFGEDYRILLQYFDNEDDFSIAGTYLSCEYTPDEDVIEGGGLSEIDWIDDNSYTLTWMSGTHPVTEKWERQPLPDKLIAFVKNSMNGKTKAKPMPKDPREQLDMLAEMADMPEKWKGYTQVLNLPEVNTPEGWYLKARTLLNMSFMQNNNNKEDKATQLLKEAAKIADGHEFDDNAEAMHICYKIHESNALLVYSETKDNPEQAFADELEVAQNCLDEFARLAPKDADRWKKELATLNENSLELSYELLGSYLELKQYKKALLSGNKALLAWSRTSDEFKNDNLYSKYLILSKMLPAARLSDNTATFEKCANELTAFLADVSERLHKGEVSMDEDTRFFMLYFCTRLINEYGKQHDYDRSEEYASLAMTFVPEERSRINYELCVSLIDNERYEEADQLHTELLKDKAFVNEYLQKSDPVADKLKKFIQPKAEVKVEEPAPTVQEVKKDEATQRKEEAQKKISAQLASVNNELKKAQGGDNRVKIKGYTASSTTTAQAKKDSKGRVALPADSAQKAGVGIHFKF